ncbi:T9SS type A sorting domain-containing protein [Hymenobacter lutimineralis]|uniref:T9SS type A sorting domain-containing protein n=1 Tax=Hymenobacter lutimineralis TaxID=2606448 RepID=A0A5D6UYZ0_9BACT|nr:CotH kinase family protein [Hymenobacter lutimineralis]TYZ07584.1 T9SS type A sorting domain-containing protein [Hymenobacter lutimineralis]
MKKLVLLGCLLSACLTAPAQTFTGSGSTIPDDNKTTSFPLTVSALATTPLNDLFGLESVCVNIVHPKVSDLVVQLQGPDGTVVDLSVRNGGSGANYTNTCFSAAAPLSVKAGAAPFSNSFRPEGVLGQFNNNRQGYGGWSLRVRDAQSGQAGSVTSWTLTFGQQPATPPGFVSSNLPIVVINTDGRTIPDEPKVDAYMGIINNGPGKRNRLADAYNDFHNKIGIEVRGSSSQMFPQKSYSIETRNTANAENDTVVLGMPEENAWVLYAPYNDKTNLRNVLSYDIANRTGHYASRTRYCELVLNGQYQGIYVMMEKIKRDANRVNIKKLDPVDISGNKLTGGYIFKIDKPTGSGGNEGWDSKQRTSTGRTPRFLYEYPKADEIQPQQAKYLQAYVDSMETALASADFADPKTGYAKYIDVSSFVDYFILNEISKNVDGLRLSTYLHKKRRSDGGKIYAGPAWDYNLAWWNADYCGGDSETGWAYNFNSVCRDDASQVPFWWTRLLQDPAFTNALQCRWKELRQRTLSLDRLNTYIDSTSTHLDEAQQRHFQRWPILGTYTWPNPSPIPADYPGEIAALKKWIKGRFAWLDANMPGSCSNVTAAQPAGPATTTEVFPNPFGQELTLRTTLTARAEVSVRVLDVTGRQLSLVEYGQLPAGKHELAIKPAQALAPGIYFVQATIGKAAYHLKVVKQ